MSDRASGNLEIKNREDLLDTLRRVLVELQGLSSRIAAVQEIATIINRTLDLEQILTMVGRQARWILDFDHCSVYLCLDDDNHTMNVLFGDDQTPIWYEDDLGSPLRRAIKSRQSQLIKDASASQHPSPLCSQIVIPLESQDEVLGTINFAHRQANNYNQEDLRIVYLLALQLASALRNAQRFTEINSLYDQLQIAHAELKSAEAFREDLMRMLVHDLRSPLSVIYGNVELIEMYTEKKPIFPEIENLVYNAVDSVQHITGLIDNLLDISKLDDSALVLNKEAFSVSNLLQNKHKLYCYRAEQQNTTLRLSLIEEDISTTADYNLLSRVLDNLINNALKYTNAGDSIELGLRLQDDAAQVYVKDSGTGIDPQYHDLIFEKFAQVRDEDGHPLRKGTGLGLAFCHMVVEAHQSQIWVESELGKGSTFLFTVPGFQAV